VVKERRKKLFYQKLNPETGLFEDAYAVEKEYALQDRDGNWRRVVEREEMTEKMGV